MFYAHAQRRRVSLDCGDKLITKQAHKDECDIHNILRQYQRTGIINHVAAARAQYGDLPDPIDFQEAQHKLMAASTAFASLPSSVRDHFGNDPGRFLSAFLDKDQEPYLRSVGLLNALPASEATSPASTQDKAT
ncbi:MAG: internal scaffolding protein [Microvirus sp.]|nr:MAG: internal scaffolding protein [Microvirus sp.]